MSKDTSLVKPISTNADSTKTAALKYATNVRGVDYSSLVNVNGKYGLFTPIATEESQEVSKDNLEQVIQSLRESITSLQSDNQHLKKQVDELSKAQYRTPDDFATAISHSVDSLQHKLYDTRNPVSRFAMREFKIEAKVHVELTPLGTVAYRFLKPEEKVDPQRLTTLEMSLVPIPKETSDLDPSAFTPFVDIEEINGIGEVYQRKLNEQQIFSINDLLTAGTRVRSRVELAALLQVDRDKLALWINQAELLTIKAIDGRKAEVLHLIGIDTLAQLAAETADTLTPRFNDKVQALDRANLKPVETEEVSQWIAAAQAFQQSHRQA